VMAKRRPGLSCQSRHKPNPKSRFRLKVLQNTAAGLTSTCIFLIELLSNPLNDYRVLHMTNQVTAGTCSREQMCHKTTQNQGHKTTQNQGQIEDLLFLITM
jgi:hypothetical protein